ncbi:MAG: hypothetical protein HYZ81_04465 [Nitrospinae bacterium]|nr:hypothetical protein [Nitrospinota bacterium]
MAKDKGHVLRVLQILSPEDQETLAILHDPPLMEEVLRRQETLTEVKAAGLALTQLFRGLWVSICTVGDIDYRLVYEIDPQDASITVLMIGAWESLERQLGAN